MLDVRAALRSLRRSPIFAVTAILTLAGGIGGTTIVFSIVHGVLVRPLPFAQPDRLVRIWETKPGDGASRVGVSTPDFFDWRDRAMAFDGMALFGGDQVLTVLDTPAGSLQVSDVDVTANLFAVLGVRPLIGRGFSIEPTAPRAVILSERLWRSAFDADPSVVDRDVRVEGGMVLPVAGVVPDGAGFPLGADLWITAPESLLRSLARDDRFFGGAVGRLRDGVTAATAQTDLVRVARDLAREYPATNAGWSVTVDPLNESIVGQYRVALLMLFGAVGFVLLVGCANIAGLMLARGVSKQRELALRAALGASRARLVRQLLADSLALALAGGVAGGLLAVVGLPLVARVASPMMPTGTTVHLDAPAFAWSGAVSLLTVLLIGLLPALFASRADFTAAIQAGGQRASSARSEPRLQRSFVAAEIALSLVLVTVAVLLIQSFVRLRHVEIGFDPAHVLSIDARIPLFRFSRTMDVRSRFLLAEEERRLVNTLRAIPGIRAVAVASEPPLGRRSIATEVTMRGGQRSVAAYHRISPGYFATLGVPRVAGRDFDDRDAVREDQYADLRRNRGPGALIVNETAARMFWPGGNALGQSVSTGVDFAVSGRTVVGVVRDTRSQAVGAPPGPEVYAPYLEDPSFAMTFLVRTPLPIEQALPTLQRAMRAVDPEISTANERTLDEIVNGASGSSRISAAVVALVATVALVLSAIGIYGLLTFSVSRRTREFGIRMALGADRHDISRLLLRETALAITVGLIVGVGGALAMTKWTASLLFGVGSRDPWSFTIAVGCLALMCLIAGYIPVRTAGHTDAAQALKME